MLGMVGADVLMNDLEYEEVSERGTNVQDGE
jgi:hypothetical protein